ncbi:MAG: LacI family DNA-binding transcriptional regulator [Chitinophagaceae bacterium]|nr:LacI family DNA-binding transcriptional regulator [Chitinophagaceae bacterium]
MFVCISPETTNINSFLKLNELDIPVIFYDKVPEKENCNKVCVADEACATMAANLIITKKKKNVLALFGNSHLLMTRKRMNAFVETINKAETNIKLTTDYALSTTEAEVLTTTYWHKQKPDTIFCMNDEILTGVMKAIQKKGLKLMEDVSVITISNGEIPKLYFPEITYVETSGFKLGKLAFSSMLSCLGGSTFIRDVSIESILVEGGSI